MTTSHFFTFLTREYIEYSIFLLFSRVFPLFSREILFTRASFLSLFFLYGQLRDTSYEVEFVVLVIFVHIFEFQSCLLLFFEFLESHFRIMSIFCILERIDHFDCLFEERSVGSIDLFPHHHHLDDIGIPVVEDILLSCWRKSRKYDCDIVTVFFSERTTVEKCLEPRVRHESRKGRYKAYGQKKTNTFLLYRFLEICKRIR